MQLLLAWHGLWLRIVELILQWFLRQQQAMLPLPTRPRHLRHLWNRWLLPLARQQGLLWRHTQPLLIQPLLSRHMILHILVLIDTLAILNEWYIRYTSRSLHTPTTSASYLLKKSPRRESPNVESRDPEHFFYGLSGNWEWSTQTADYWRHHFEIPLLHGHNPFRHVAIDTALPPEATSSLTTISTLAGRLSDSLTATRASGESADIWRMVENMSFHDAIQALQEASSSTSWYTEWSLATSLYRRYTAIRASSYNWFRLSKTEPCFGRVCVTLCIDVKLLILVLIMQGFAKLDVWCCMYHSWAQLDSSKRKPCLGRVCVWHIWIDVKLLLFVLVSDLRNVTYSCRGTRHPWPTMCNEATVLDGISGLITLTYLLFCDLLQ